MGRIISEGLAQPDDPMFTGRVETFSVRKAKKPLATTPSGTVGAPLDILASFGEDDPDALNEPENDGVRS
jgi:hypothetical protein